MTRPESEEELAAMIAAATAPLSLRGGHTRAGFAPLGEPLSLAGLGGLRLYEPAALTVVAGAGMALTELEALLAEQGQRLAFEPPDLRRFFGREGESTLGGIAASNAAGPRRFLSGAARDHMIGLRFVDGQGLAIRAGGRVMKNVTGYDLVKLLAGSAGRLGAISELAFRVQPKPECSATLALHRLRAPAAAMARALSSAYEVSGAALSGQDPDGRVSLWLRLEGFEASVAYRLARLEALLGAQGGEVERITDPAQSQALWRRIRDLDDLSAADLVLRASIRPARLEQCAAALARFDGLQLRVDQGGGVVFAGAALTALQAWGEGRAAGAASGAEAEALPGLRGGQALIEALQNFCAKEGGHASVLKAPDRFWPHLSFAQPLSPGVAALNAALRARFDPRGILNSGGPC